MANQAKYQLYDKGTRQWFPVTEEQYKAYGQECAALRREMQKQGRCMCPGHKWWVCDMNCMDCEYRKDQALSLDTPMADGDVCLADMIPDESSRMEEELANSDLLAWVKVRLRELHPDADTMLDMWTKDDGISDRAMARALGCPQRTLADRMKRIRIELQRSCEC